MRIGFIGCVDSSKIALEALLAIDDIEMEVVAVITKKQSKLNADFVDLTGICSTNDIPFHYERANEKEESLKFMESYQPDVVYCIGWSYLLGREFLTMPPLGIIGFHPAKLPENRGRHPIIWALALGLTNTASTFFKLAEGADTGPILSQTEVLISSSDDARTLYEKILVQIQLQIPIFTDQLCKGTAIFVEQDHTRSNNWRKRTRKDGLIDWRMRAEDIYNLIRALTRPYPGAEFIFNGSYISVWSSMISIDKFPLNIEPGFVLSQEDDWILVKCGRDTAIKIFLSEDMVIRPGEYL